MSQSVISLFDIYFVRILDMQSVEVGTFQLFFPFFGKRNSDNLLAPLGVKHEDSKGGKTSLTILFS
jgi:hypothetical protein